MGVKKSLESAAIAKAIDYLIENPEERIPKIMNLVNKAVPEDLYPSQRKAITNAINMHNNWYELILRVTELNPDVMRRMIKTFVLDANFDCWPTQEENRKKYQCNIPWAMLLDPTSACNLHCTGCWAADFGNQLSLSYEDIDSIIEQSKALGTHMFIYTGGEPLVRKKDIIKLCEKHQDCAFLSFTNATLIDEEFCQDLERVANFIPAISVEGFEEATDSRRGEGTFKKVVAAMDLMKKHGLPFGVSCCYTSANYKDIGSEEFIDWLIDKGALFAWFFTYMPIGKSAPTDLMASPEAREHMYHFIRAMRDTKPLFTMDFWNDGEYVGGCIAGGRRYLHISAAGDVEPCVFAHYANANIHKDSVLDALRSPIFMEYYENQPFDKNLLRPCPILDNKGRLAEMVERSGAKSTNPQDGEPAEELCEKCYTAADEWKPVADRLWDDPNDSRYDLRHKEIGGMADSDMDKFERIGRKRWSA
ncbi:MAG: radical SAM protein [Coriobacteriales bacterium]|jgi:MoaA/NifB/PqqE/SkfB family radical SAM enzyme